MTLTISALSLNDQALSQPFVAHFDASGGTIGRGEQNTLMLPDPERHISRQHARISADGAGFRITNLSSANVVTVAGRALSAGESAPIRHRDQVRIGGFLLEVSDSASSPPPLGARTITEGRAAALARSGGTGAGSQPALPVPASGARAAGAAGASSAPPAPPVAPVAAPHDDPFADLFGPPITPPVRPARTPDVRAPADDPFADLLGPPAAAPQAPVRGPATPAAGAGPGVSRTPGPPARAPAAPDDPFGDFGDFSPVTPLPAAPVGRAPQQAGLDDALGAFVSGPGTAPGRSAGAPADLLADLGNDPSAARAVDDLLGGPGDGADALAAFLDDSPKTPARAAAAPAGAASNHVHDLNAAFSPSSFDLGRVAGGGAPAGGGSVPPAGAQAPLAPRPAAAAPLRPPPESGTRFDVAPSRPASAPSAPVPLAGVGGAPAPVVRPAVAAPSGPPLTPVRSTAASPAAAPAGSMASSTASSPAMPVATPPVSAPVPLAPARPTAPAALSRPAPLGDVAPAVPRAPRAAVPSGAVAGEPVSAASTAAPAAAPTASRDELWQAFCEAAGVHIDAPQGLSPEMMRVIGQLLRSAVDGTVQLMAIRSATKHELRAEMTLIQPRNNNPLKFSPDGHAALELLLQPPMRGFLPGPAAMTDAMHDLVGHSIGTMAGMRAALDGVLGRFAPAQLENKLTGTSVIDSLIPMNRRSRLWELYLQHFETIRDEAQDDFHTLFGRAFLAAYEQQLDRLHEQQAAGSPAPGARRP